MRDTVKIDKRGVRLIAHRGLSGIEQENTCAAFIAAANRESYYGIETDVYRTSDGKYVLHHDDRVCTGAYIPETDFDTLRAVVMEDKDGRELWDLRVPTLDEYVRICKNYGKVGVLEIKQPELPVEYLREIIDIIKAEDYLDGIIFIGFSFENMLNIRKMLPDQTVQFLSFDWKDEYFDMLVRNRIDLDIAYGALTEENAHRLHEAGVEINIWTCDSAEVAEKYIGYGVDYITTDILE